uniref:Uncharacterized protein n=1 Tax=Kalanchoe fedtschenkoi TaxID=63787 RepID=A0A7N0TSZ9_KALFE
MCSFHALVSRKKSLQNQIRADGQLSFTLIPLMHLNNHLPHIFFILKDAELLRSFGFSCSILI